MAKRRKKKNQVMNKDITVVILIVISILLAVLIYGSAGTIGKTINPILGGLVGYIKYLLPIATFVVAIYIACDDKKYIISKLIQCAVFLMCVSIILTTYQISKGNITTSNGFSNAIEESYKLGSKTIGGGAIGAIIAIPLINMFSPVGAIIVSIGILITLFVFIFGIKPSEILASIIERAEEKKEEVKEEKTKNKELKLKLKEEQKKNKKQIIPEEILEDQITINLGKTKTEPKKYTHDADLIPEKKNNPNELENLFKQEQEVKEEKTKEVLQLEHTLTVEEENYEFPPIELLSEGTPTQMKGGKKAVTDTATKLQKTLYSFGVSAKVENVSVGPAITRYELKPAEGVRVSKIANLADDIALNLAAESIRIEAPIPGKQAVGIEIPNKEKEMVHLRDIIDTEAFKNDKSKLAFALGKNVAGEEVVTDIAKMPHVLIAGSTGSGKSVCINTLIASII
ncbi:MAG: DNA translocase FtsK, partial [Oscillospiraceae bacterium]|nr:DNA translocase FtsK [Oscillospiraceae bacterium]